ncbi:MAG: zeta toxin family protein, partial [Planctomycetales bacterium]|nr:zeta toxin family protein [Planctomycetales bacterium]
IIIVAGPNGAGKTTFAKSFLPAEAACPIFINADLIAAGLSPFQPERAAITAGRLMLAEIRRLASNRESFSFETTLSGLTYGKMIPEWRSTGYHVHLLFLKLRSVRLAHSRVRTRVRQGGHAIPFDVIRRRFRAGWRNFQTVYRPLVDQWELFDNSGLVPQPLEFGRKS